MSVTPIILAAIGGGTVGSVLSQALAIQNERTARIRKEKIDAFRTVLELNESARAALTDLRHALDDSERLIKENGTLTPEQLRDLEAIRACARSADEADTRAHAAIRESRRRSIEMTMMFSPRAKVSPASLRQRAAFRRLRRRLKAVRDAIERDPRDNRDQLWNRVKEARKERRAAERELIASVYEALWPWWHRRARSLPDEEAES